MTGRAGRGKSVLWRVGAGTSVVLLASALSALTPATGRAAATSVESPRSAPVVGGPIDHGDTAPLSDLPPDQGNPQQPAREGPAHRMGHTSANSLVAADGVAQTSPGATPAPTPGSFEGTGNLDAVVPPDTDGAVGPSAYVELVNQHLQVFPKSSPTTPNAPIAAGAIWQGFSTSSSAAKLCNTNPGGDGIVLYDRGADRWLISQLAFTSNGGLPKGPYVECFAISKTNDPAGAYYIYAYQLSSNELPDYPKIGIFANSYYLSANMFASVFASTSSPEVWAFDRSSLLAGAGGQYVTFAGYVPTSFNTILPADVDGPTQPPAGEGEIFAGLDSSNNTTLGLFQFSPVDWTNPGAATFAQLPSLAVAPYATLCPGTQNCLPQRGTSQLLDSVSDRVMYRLAYRNLGTHEALLVNHSVNVATSGTQAGVRWYEIDHTPGGAYSVAQQSTYAPDATTSRWMGSVAMNSAGDIALGYSSTSTTSYPSVNFTGRHASDSAGQMSFAEGTIVQGLGAQTGYDRWGDYTRMAVDPADDCTFWYVGEYYAQNASYSWHTRIGNFQLSNCTPSPDFALSVTPASQTVLQGSSGSYTVNITPSNGFNAGVALSAGPMPSGATATFSPNNTAMTTSALTITTSATTPAGSYPFTITGTSGTLTHTTPATLIVNPAGNFTILASPSSQTVAAGSAATYSVTVTPSGSFNSPVTLSVTGLPSGASGSFSPNPTTASSTLTVSTTTNVASTSTLTITGVSSNLSSSTTVSLAVNSSSAPPVIHISTMGGIWQVNSRNWSTWGYATILDQSGVAVAGATVTFTFSGGTAASQSCVTDSTGYCQTSTPVIVSLKKDETITATNVVKSGDTWDGVKWTRTLLHP